MPLTIEQMYDATIKPLPTSERLRLARLILNDIPDESLIDYNDDWSEEDLRDASRYSLRRHVWFPGTKVPVCEAKSAYADSLVW
jgi:hypothetical protein